MNSTFTYKNEVQQILADVFDSMLQVSISPAPAPGPETYDLEALVTFAGAWNGSLVIECTLPQAIDWTARLMDIDPPKKLNDDVRDALGELANMIGGNMKAILPPRNRLSIPNVCLKSEAIPSNTEEGTLNSRVVVLQGSLGSFSVSLLEGHVGNQEPVSLLPA